MFQATVNVVRLDLRNAAVYFVDQVMSVLETLAFCPCHNRQTEMYVAIPPTTW